jgi:hypothetical protein
MMCQRAGLEDAPLGAFHRAIGFTEDAAARQFLLRRRAEPRRAQKPVIATMPGRNMAAAC